ncbi:MAG: FRG domain-containing protein [Oscillospiraceae bacterium]|nr:FRG domain-containing protein [Oscillospiraceae bacterium]
MSSIIVNLSKQINGFAGIEKLEQGAGDYVGALLGHYDYFEMLSCERMADFFFFEQEYSNLQKHDYEKQKLHLYTTEDVCFGLDENVNQNSQSNTSNPCIARPINIQKKCKCILSSDDFIPSFIMLTLLEVDFLSTIMFHNNLEINTQSSLLIELSKIIEEIVHALYDDNQSIRLSFIPMLSMSQNEVAIIWYVNNVDVPGKIIAYLRDIKVSIKHGSSRILQQMFIGSRTLVSIMQKASENKNTISTNAKLVISLSYKEPCNKDEFIESLAKQIDTDITSINIYERYGSNDTLLELPLNENVTALYTEKNANKENPFDKYCTHVHSRVSFPKINYKPLKTISLEIKKNITQEDYKKITKLIENKENIRARIDSVYNGLIYINSNEKEKQQNPFFHRNPFIRDALYLLYTDFFRCNESMPNLVWAKDLEEQFISVLNAINLIINKMPEMPYENKFNKKQDDEKLIEDINKLIQCMQQIHGQVSQGNKLFYEAPGASLPYSGSFRSVIWMYNGILKRILSIIYSTRRDTKQKKIIPILTFGMTPVIKVDMLETYYNTNGQKEILLLYQLPAAALYSILPFTYYLLHESHHFSAPSSRYIRNMIIANEVVCNYLLLLLSNSPQNKDNEETDSSSSKKMNNELYNLLTNEFITSYEAIIHELLGTSNPVRLDASSSLFVSALIKSLNDIRSKKVSVKEHLRKMLENIQKNELHKSVFKAINIILDSNTYTDYKAYEEINSTVFIIIDSIHEACCDLFMIQVSNMSVFQYLDFICDYFYTTMKQFDPTPECLPETYTIRLGMILDYYCSTNDDIENNIQDYDAQAFKILSQWECNNENHLKINDKENKENHRTEFRLSVCNCFKGILQKYRDTTINRIKLQELMRIGNFDIIANNLFDCAIDDSCELTIENNSFNMNAGLINRLFEEYNKIQTSEETKIYREKDLMKLSINIIQYFSGQTQSWSDIWNESMQSKDNYLTLNNYKIINDTLNSHNVIDVMPRNYEYEFHVFSFNDFIPSIASISDIFQYNKHDEVLWYRGVENQNYGLTPSIYRLYNDKEELKGRSGLYQNNLLNEFIARASNSGDINLTQVSSSADWLSVMQHYSAKTHFLDWSEQLFGAMYFMLEPLIRLKNESTNMDIKTREKKTKEIGAALYILAPHRLNAARLESIKKVEHELVDNMSKKYEKCIKQKIALYNRYSNIIPNLSREEKDSNFDSFLLGCKNCSECNEKIQIICQAQMPIAIQTNRSNKRISAQAGTFVAFSTNAFAKSLNYDLLNIQKKWIEDRICKEPFVYKLVIHKHAM